MDQDSPFRQLLQRSLLALLLCSILVALCYFLVDRQVAYLVRDHGFSRLALLRWLTYPPPILETWTPAVLAALMVRRAWGPFQRWEWTLLAVCVSLLVTGQFVESLKHLFNRTWPGTWSENHDNPSLLGKDGAYGFFWFPDTHGDKRNWYASFPSGHTARVVAIVSVVWIAYPWWRWACVLATLAIVVGLIGMNYHFVSDVIAGGVIGGIVGAYTAELCGLRTPSLSSQTLSSRGKRQP